MRLIQDALKPLRRQIDNMVARAVVKLVDDTLKMQELQIEVLKGEVRDKAEHWHPYGFTAVPHEGAEAVVVFPKGMREHALVLVVGDRRYRLKGLEKGEVALYTDEGDKIHIKRGGTIEVVAATKLLIDAPETELTGNLTVAGNVQVDGDVHADGEVEAGEIGLTTHKHGGVQTGAGQTGGPVP